MVIKLFIGNYARDLFLSTGATTLAHRSGVLIMAVDARIMEAPERLGHGDVVVAEVMGPWRGLLGDVCRQRPWRGPLGDVCRQRPWRGLLGDAVSPKALEWSAWRCVSPKALEVPRGTWLWQMRWWHRSWVIWFSILNELLFESLTPSIPDNNSC